MDNNEILTIEQVIEKLKCSDRYIKDSIGNGELTAYKRGHRYYIFYEDLVAFIKGGKEASKLKEKEKEEGE